MFISSSRQYLPPEIPEEDLQEAPKKPSCIFELRINRLKSTLKGRLALLNAFKSIIDDAHKPLTFENIGIDVNSEEEITNYIETTNVYIEDVLLKDFDSWMFKNGTHRQIIRLLNHKKGIGRGKAA